MTQQQLERRLGDGDLGADLRRAPSYRLLVALWGGLAVVDGIHLLGGPVLLQVAAVTALVAVCSARTGRLTALAIAGIGWLLLNGFVVNTLGELHWQGAADALRAGLLLVVALAARQARR